MACDSESMESFNILWQQTINGDISQLILSWKDGDGYYIVVNALCDWGKVCFVDESFREANKIIVEN